MGAWRHDDIAMGTVGVEEAAQVRNERAVQNGMTVEARTEKRWEGGAPVEMGWGEGQMQPLEGN